MIFGRFLPKFGDPFLGFPMLGIIKDYGIWVYMGVPAFMEIHILHIPYNLNRDIG